MKHILLLGCLLMFSISFGQKKNTIQKEAVTVNTENKSMGDADITIEPASDKIAVMDGDDEIYSSVGIEATPEYKGGMKEFHNEFNKKFKFNPDSEDDIRGRIYLEFIVEKNGELSNIKAIRDLSQVSIAAEVIKIVKTMPKWKPGIQNGKAVRTRFALPIEINIKANTDYNSYSPKQ